MESLTTRQVRRLALCRAGLLKPEWTGLPTAARGRGQPARRACHEIIRRFGYLQLDSIAVAGARTHALVLMSRLKGLDPPLAEELLQPGEPIFEYLGHEACWHPMQDWPLWGFRRRELQDRPRWGRFVAEHRRMADWIVERIGVEGPLRSLDLDGERFGGNWQHKVATYVASALWGMGVLAIRERRGFQRVYDLTERVIPDELRGRGIGLEEALPSLALSALDGHGWSTRGTIAATWRLTNRGEEIDTALAGLREAGDVTQCQLVGLEGARTDGWIRPADIELAHRLDRLRPRQDVGVLLSPFDPVLWDRLRVQRLFRFDQVLEIYKPATERRYGYYCLPVLAGDQLVARVDLKADRKTGRVRVLSQILEDDRRADHREAVGRAVGRHVRMLGMGQ
jgi:uncharacterized protein YcaQ